VRWQEQRLSRRSQRQDMRRHSQWAGQFCDWESANNADWRPAATGQSHLAEVGGARQPGATNGSAPGGGDKHGGSSIGGGGGAGGRGEGVTDGGSSPAEEGHSLEDKLSPEAYRQMLRDRGLDCRGWNLVVTGHSLGAAVAALVGLHSRSWCPGEQAGKQTLLCWSTCGICQSHRFAC
jgi:hypothetical protein